MMQIQQIGSLAVEMRDATSNNDDRREKLQSIVDLCDDLLNHFTDDGR